MCSPLVAVHKSDGSSNQRAGIREHVRTVLRKLNALNPDRRHAERDLAGSV